MELLPHDVIQYILEKLDVKTLLKLLERWWCVSVKIPTTWENKFYQVCNSSCDGLICFYDSYDGPSIVVNRTTRWHRTLPPCNYQLVAFDRIWQLPSPSPVFGKDKINGTNKTVWLYKSAELGLKKNKSTTTCEVFYFTTNAWRYIVPASPNMIHHSQAPVYCDGSLHWFTNSDETNVLSLDLHTETFQIIPEPPFLHGLFHGFITPNLIMCSLDDRLCVSERIFARAKDKTWKKIYSINLRRTSSWFRDYLSMLLTPLSVLEKDKLLFYDRESSDGPLVAYDLRTKYYNIAYKCNVNAYPLCFVPSLISIL
ncbi:LOW QUALITY PROTEIN: hypothetical protein N665_0613s0007 [Sinapis alba]|nr:LOW QUALITY PROTEIN: hypothetical protein N665_0613s0007 [Sinapis alba]